MRNRFALSPASFTVWRNVSSRRPISATCQSWFANASAMACPTPLPAPVTTAVLLMARKSVSTRFQSIARRLSHQCRLNLLFDNSSRTRRNPSHSLHTVPTLRFGLSQGGFAKRLAARLQNVKIVSQVLQIFLKTRNLTAAFLDVRIQYFERGFSHKLLDDVSRGIL